MTKPPLTEPTDNKSGNRIKRKPKSPSSASGEGGVLVDADSQPPFTNRGVLNTNPDIEISIHWLEITFFCSPKKPMMDFMREYHPWILDSEYMWDEDIQLRGSTGRYYKAIYDGPDGVVLYAYPNNGTYCSLQISGSAIDKMGQDAIYRLLERFGQRYLDEKVKHDEKYHWHCTRIDIAFDGVPFTPAKCRDAWLSENVRTRIRPTSYDWRSNSQGDTFYAGKRISGRLIRVYNRRGPTRFELELKKNYAIPFVENLRVNGFMSLGENSLGVIRDMLDFVDRKSDKNLSRATTLPWWKQFVGEAERIRYTQSARDLTASMEEYRVRANCERMRVTLFFAHVVLGIDLHKIAVDAENNLKPHHRIKLMKLRPNHKFRP